MTTGVLAGIRPSTSFMSSDKSSLTACTIYAFMPEGTFTSKGAQKVVYLASVRAMGASSYSVSYKSSISSMYKWSLACPWPGSALVARFTIIWNWPLAVLQVFSKGTVISTHSPLVVGKSYLAFAITWVFSSSDS